MSVIIKSKLNYSIHPTTLKTIKLKLLKNGNGSLGLPTLQNLILVFAMVSMGKMESIP